MKKKDNSDIINNTSPVIKKTPANGSPLRLAYHKNGMKSFNFAKQWLVF